MCVPSIAGILLACFVPETLATKVHSSSSEGEEAAGATEEVRRIPIRSERSESFCVMSFMNNNGGDDDDDDDMYNM
jgi:hypothetical protein